MFKIQQIRQHQYFKLSAAIALLLLALAAWLTFFNRSYLVVILDHPGAEIFVDGRKPENVKTLADKTIVKLWPGIHTVRIIAPDIVDFAQTIRLFRGLKKTINPALNIVPKTSTRALGDVQFLSLNQDENAVYYLGERGSTIFEYDLDKSRRLALTSANLAGVLAINFSPNFKLAIVKKTDGFWLYDFGRYNLVNIEPIKIAELNEITMPVWDPLGNSECLKLANCLATPTEIKEWRIAYINLASPNKFLTYADQLNKNREEIAITEVKADAGIFWSPSGREIVFAKNSGIAVFDVIERTNREIAQGKSIEKFKLSSDGQKIVYRSGGALNIINLDGSADFPLNLNSSLEKIIVPQSQFAIAAIFDPKINSDRFFKLNLDTDEKIEYRYQTNEAINATEMVFSDKNANLLFQSNNRLYSLLLKEEN